MVKTKLKIQQESRQMMSSSSSCEKKKYKGVRMRSWGSWVSEIRAPNQKTRIWLGSYSTPEAAARAYDAALLCLKGSAASLNFPITSSSYIPDTIMSPKSIQRMAASAANSSNVDNGAATPPPISLPPSFTSSSSSSSVSSSPSDQVHDDDDVSLIKSLVAGAAAANSFVDNATTTTPPSLSPQPTSSTSTSSVSTPSISSSSPSDQVDHDDDNVSLIQSLVANDQPVSITEPWYSDILLSPNYIDQMFDLGSSDSSTMVNDFYEEADILLWSFC